MKTNFKNLLSCGLESLPAISYPPISIDGVELPVTKKQKYLRLIFDYSLS